MKNWEFLIQKEGDRAWQSSTDSNLEISPGSYRIMAHSPYPNQEVEVRIIQEEIQENALTTTRQTQTRRTNPQGLLMVIPYTYINPGRWEIRCSGDIMTELLGNSWQEVLHLEVKAAKTPEISSSLEELVPSPTSPVQDYISELEQILQEKIEPFLQPLPEVATTFKITLEEDTFIRNLGEKVTVNGQVQLEQGQESSLPLSSKLIYQLQRTQTGEKVFQVEYTLTSQNLLAPFSHTLNIPDEPAITFLLGEIVLATAEGTTLTKQCFSISTDVLAEDVSEDLEPEPEELTPVPQVLTKVKGSFNHSILPPKIVKERLNYEKRTVELPPIRPR